MNMLVFNKSPIYKGKHRIVLPVSKQRRRVKAINTAQKVTEKNKAFLRALGFKIK